VTFIAFAMGILLENSTEHKFGRSFDHLLKV